MFVINGDFVNVLSLDDGMNEYRSEKVKKTQCYALSFQGIQEETLKESKKEKEIACSTFMKHFQRSSPKFKSPFQ